MNISSNHQTPGQNYHFQDSLTDAQIEKIKSKMKFSQAIDPASGKQIGLITYNKRNFKLKAFSKNRPLLNLQNMDEIAAIVASILLKIGAFKEKNFSKVTINKHFSLIQSKDREMKKIHPRKIQNEFNRIVKSTSSVQITLSPLKATSTERIAQRALQRKTLSKMDFGSHDPDSDIVQNVQLEGTIPIEFPHIIDRTYTFDGREVGTEVITEENVCQRALNYLNHMKNQAQEPKDKAFYQLEIDKVFAYQKLNHGKQWLDSNFFRDLIRRSRDYNLAADHYFSAPINMHYHEIKKNKNDPLRQMGFYQCGVMSDMRNGWFSLSDLKRIKNHPKVLNEKIDRLNKHRLYFMKEVNKKDKQNTFANKLQSINRALNELSAIRKNPDKLDRLIEERQKILEMQMIQLVIAQAEKNPKLIKRSLENNLSFKIAHIALLNPQKVDLDRTGWMHDERVEIEDMKEIFETFHQRKLICDGSGPRIEGDNIYLPPLYDENHQEIKFDSHPREIVLKTLFFNLSVQGYTKNEGVQKKINHSQTKRLKKILPQFATKHPKLLAEVNGKRSNYLIAEQLTVGLIDQGSVAVSMGCLSAKDRTGYVGHRVIQNYVSRNMADQGIHKDNPYSKDIFNKDNPCIRLIQKNTPQCNVMKVDPRADLPGTNFLRRINNAARMSVAYFENR